MSARTPSPQAGTATSAASVALPEATTERLGWTEVPARLRLALLLAVVAAALAAVAPGLGVTVGGPPPGYASGPLLIVLALLPAALAVGLVAASRPILAAGVLVGAALLAPGRALADFQFVVDALATSRPDLLVPTSLAPLRAGTGSWLLLAGHAVTVVAGVLAAGRAGAKPGSAMAVAFEESAPSLAEQASRRRWLGLLLGPAVITAIGLLMPPFESGDAFQPQPDLMNGPTPVMVGGLMIAVGLLSVCVIAGGAAAPSFARGVVIGASVAALAVLVPAQAAGFLVDRLDPDWRSYLGVVGAVALVVLAVRPPREDRKDGKAAATGDHLVDGTAAGARLHLAAGVLGLLAAAAAIGGAFGTLLRLEIPEDQPISATDRLYLLSGAQPITFANKLLLPAGVLLAVLGLLLLIRPVASVVRPAFTVACVSVPLAGMLALDAVLTVSGTAASIRPDLGTWSAVAAIVLAAAAGICAVIAGGLERDEVDLSERVANLMLAAPAAGAALFALGAFGLPTLTAPGYVPAGVWSEFRLASWGLVAALLAVVVATLVAVFSRPSRAVALLLGAAALVVVHVLELPLTGARVPNAGAGPGTWLSLACIAALLVSALIAVVTRPRHGASRQ